MTKTARGVIRGQGDIITGEFHADGRPILAKIHLNRPIPEEFEGPEAILEYDNLADLQGPFKIDPDSVIGPDKLYILLKNESGVAVTIKAVVLPPLPISLREGGKAIFIQPE